MGVAVQTDHQLDRVEFLEQSPVHINAA